MKIKDPKTYYWLLVVIFIGYFIVKNITSSVFLKEKDKVNIVFYGATTRFYSLDKSDVDYIVTFTPNAKVLVPGGYGFYRLGSLNKLVSLEKKPELFKKTLSIATSSFVDLYFYPNSDDIFYKNSQSDDLFPSLREIFLNRSNASLIDRIFVLINLSNKNQNLYKIIRTGDDFDSQKFNNDYQGSFYEKTYRTIGDNVQITYTKSYETAMEISQIIDGEGIRVVDVSQVNQNDKQCQIIVKKDKVKSETAMGLSRFFGCPIKIGDTEVSDIILVLGSLEKDWALQ